MTRKVQCALCKRDFPASECEQSIRGWECKSCLDRKLSVAIRKLGVVKVEEDGSYYMVVEDGEAEPS